MKKLLSPNENTAFLLPTYPNGCLEIHVAAVV
jgi:hypothetical protein